MGPAVFHIIYMEKTESEKDNVDWPTSDVLGLYQKNISYPRNIMNYTHRVKASNICSITLS